MGIDIDSLQIEIEATSADAAEKVDSLATALTNLKTAAKGGAGLTSVVNQINKLKEALTGISGNASVLKSVSDTLRSFSGSASGSVSALGSLSRTAKSAKVDYSSLSEEVKSVASSFASLPSNVQSSAISLAKAKTAIDNLSGTKVSVSLDEARNSLESLKQSANTSSSAFAKLKSAFSGTQSTTESVASAYASLPPAIQKAILANSALETSNTKTAKSFGVLGTGISSAKVKFGIYFLMAQRVASAMSNWVKESNDYVENLNLFNVSMGEYAESAKEYAEQVQAILGIDSSKWMRNQGVFMQMASGFGVVSDDAALMSKNLTQLGYDISSFYNISIEEAMTKLQSGLAGEIEPLRRLGYAIDQASLQQVALNLGITESVASMNQAEKSQLRYIAIMQQSGNVMGDLSRTIQTPANAMRILNQQITQLSRALGNLLIPALQLIIPWVQAFVSVLTELIQALAVFFGFELPKIDYSGLGGISAGASEAEDAMNGASGAAKELKKTLLGIDELNLLAKESDSGGGGGGAGVGGGGGLGMELPEYDFLGDAEAQLNDLKERLKDILVNYVVPIGAGFAAWKISSSLLSAISKLTGLAIPSLIPIGTGIAVGGFTFEFTGIADAIKNGLEKFNFAQIIIGGLIGTGGSALLGKGIGQFIATAFSGSAVAKAITAGGGAISTGLIGAAVGGIVAGVPAFVAGVYDAIKNGIDLLSASLISVGATAAGAGIGAIIGSLGGPIGAGIGALIGLAVGVITDLGILIYQKWEDIVSWFSQAFSSVGEFFSGIWNTIYESASSAISYILEVFSPVTDWFSEMFSSINQTASDVFYNIGVIASGAWTIIETAWGIASEWFSSNVIQPISGFFTTMWQGIKDGAVGIWNDIKSDFSQFASSLATTFMNVWNGIVNLFSFGGDIFVQITEGIFSVFKSVINGLISGLNQVIAYPINQLNDVLMAIKGFNIFGVYPFSGLRKISIPQIPTFANGGFPEQGQMFIANEQGPELVGQIGNRTAVANNDQIVTAVSQGVYDANAEQNAILREQNRLLTQILEKTGVSIDGYEFANSLTKYQSDRKRALGV